jgi:hypothetical protein
VAGTDAKSKANATGEVNIRTYTTTK